MKGIEGRQKSVGTVFIQETFSHLKRIIEVDVPIIDGDVTSLLFLKDRITNSLEISIHNETLSFNGITQPLRLENFFLIPEWSPTDIPYDLYCKPNLLPQILVRHVVGSIPGYSSLDSSSPNGIKRTHTN